MTARKRVVLPIWTRPLLWIPVVLAVGWWTHEAIEERIRARLRETLETTLNADGAALELWIQDQVKVASLAATDARVVDLVVELLEVSRRTSGNPQALRAAPQQARLRALLSPILAMQQSLGYTVIDPGGLIVSRMVDDDLGSRVQDVLAQAAARAFADETPFVPPTTKQHFSGKPMAFVVTAIRDRDFKPVAALAIRALPDQMSRILNVARFGETGETYAVDGDGVMISESRFTKDVVRFGLIPAEAEGRCAGYLEVRNPGHPLTASKASKSVRKSLPLTLAAAEVTSDRSGSDLSGYLDYRGVPVVGSWSWMPAFGIGIISEVDKAEAYGSLAVISRAFWILAGALMLGALGLAFASRTIRSLEKQVDRAQRLGQYTLEEKIGEGGMGAVYRARHALLRRPTAIKLLRGDTQDAEAVARFEREVQLTSQLTHPNTVAIYDYGRTPDGVFYYAMEFLPGIPLDRLVQNEGALPEARVVHILKQICGSLAEAHAVGLVHRDIKPANVILCKRGTSFDVVKVLDFGLVKDVVSRNEAQVTGTQVVVGTPHYMAPEAVTRPDTVDASSDVYGVGAVGYVLLTGQNVFPSDSSAKVIGDLLHTQPTRPSVTLGRPVDPFLEQLILRCLSKDRAQRPFDAGRLLEEIELGWKGEVWSQRSAAAWWADRAEPLLTPAPGSRPLTQGTHLSVDVESRVRSSDDSRSTEKTIVQKTTP